MYSLIKLVKNTHKHPANRALHCIGAPFYAIGLILALGSAAGLNANPIVGVSMWAVAVGMFVSGHIIEGNVRAMTPIVLLRLLSKVLNNFATKRVHFLWA